MYRTDIHLAFNSVGRVYVRVQSGSLQLVGRRTDLSCTVRNDRWLPRMATQKNGR